MSGVIGETSNGLGFMYESDASSSFLVVRCEESIVEYQVRMLENNDIRYVVPVEMVKKEGINHFFYNITSKIPLSLYLKRYKLSREEFLRLLLSVSVCIGDSSGYLLTPSNFVLNAEYMYIDPGTLEVMLIYIPANIKDNAAETLQSFVSDLLMQHIHEEGFASGNLVQRMLSEVKSESFNVKGFIKLINELLYGQQIDVTAYQQQNQDKDNCNKILEEYNRKDKIEEKHVGNESKDSNNNISPVILAVLLQFLLGGAIYMCRSLLDNAGGNPAATYAAVILIVLSIEVLVFKKLYDMKLFSIKGVGKAKDNTVTNKADSSEPQRTQIEKATGHTLYGEGNSFHRRPKIDENGSNSVYPEQLESSVNTGYVEPNKSGVHIENAEQPSEEAARYVMPSNSEMKHQKTELLGTATKEACVLKCTDRFNGGQDIIIDKDEFIIGRLSGHVDYVLHNNAVGKLHAELICRNGSCYVKDLSSINGTYINNLRIESNKEIELKDNDSLLFANSEFIFIGGHRGACAVSD